MNDLAIVTVFNNLELANQMTRTAEETRGLNSCQFFIIDNRGNNKYKSAASAYNHVLDKMPEAKVFIFCHQDIIFLNKAIQEIYNLCINDPNTLFGAAGVNIKKGNSESRIISSMALIQEGWNYKSLQKGTTKEVFSLDECLICGSRSIFEKMRFDETVCDGWHLYAADYSMQCHVNGINVKVFDADIVHLSGGKPDKSFYNCEKKLAKKYRNIFPIISYTCGWTYTDPLRYFILRMYRKLRYGI